MFLHQVPRISYSTAIVEPRQVPTVTTQQVPVVTYPYTSYAYSPMFIDLIFSMLFLLLPIMLIVPLFKSLASALSSA